MSAIGSQRSARVGRVAGPKWSAGGFVEFAAMLAASTALALLVAAAGNALTGHAFDAPSLVAPPPPVNILEVCSGQGEQRRCIQEAS
jgi:hypothetical protein